MGTRSPLRSFHQVGDTVATNAGACFSEYALVSERMVTAVDPGKGREAVALTLSALTACAALEVGDALWRRTGVLRWLMWHGVGGRVW